MRSAAAARWLGVGWGFGSAAAQTAAPKLSPSAALTTCEHAIIVVSKCMSRGQRASAKHARQGQGAAHLRRRSRRVVAKASRHRRCRGTMAVGHRPPTSGVGICVVAFCRPAQGGPVAPVPACPEHVSRSCAARCSGNPSVHPVPRSIHAPLGPAPAVGDGRPTSVACAQRWDLGPAMVLLKRATHRPRPGALRPKSMLSAGPAVFFRVGLPMEAAPPR